ncbi:uncharacterized protein AB675_179 [Cyphellophora attinorum]|uniref:Uncharacterized protein n=1 Tax=Cyphellophora attinorum TaxID=1664694 RepID=A0A0N1H5Q3_9EURO|nr:uncharacterized protein AB675_179 [Phialophora attinorum]KPI37795.1 hypothetical protein AB675_179 [Phialophora attinorum]
MEFGLGLFLSLSLQEDRSFQLPSPLPKPVISLPHTPPASPYPFPHPIDPNWQCSRQSTSAATTTSAAGLPESCSQVPAKATQPKTHVGSTAGHTRLRRPTDNNEAVIELLNLHLIPDVPIDDLVPADFLSNRPYPYDAEFEDLLAEIGIENEDAFREVLRQVPKEGRSKPRITYSRNFYGSLEDMSRYMDSSEDNYFDATDDDTDADGDSKMSDIANSTAKKTTPMYKGHRLGNAAQVPSATRNGLVRNLLKMVIHKFNCRDYDISMKERLRIRDVNLPQGLVMYHFMIGKVPTDRALARARYVEGPVMSVSIRHESVFNDKLYSDLMKTREKAEVGDCLGAEVDLLRETGAALATALQRNREGKKKDSEHDRVTQDWWWARNPRWGGGEMKWGMLANEVFEDEDPSWSPEEFRLQTEKRDKAQDEMRKIDEIAKGNDRLSVEDMIAKSEKAASLSGGSDGANPPTGLSAEQISSRISTLTPTENAIGATPGAENDEKPPKKKNRLTVPVSSSDNATEKTSSSTNTSSLAAYNDSQTPANTVDGIGDATPPTPTSPSETSSSHSLYSQQLRNGPSNPAMTTTRIMPRQSISASRTAETKRKEEGEFKDGRRLMYTAPMRRKWFQQWKIVKPNVSSWDERVVWRRIGCPEAMKDTAADEHKDTADGIVGGSPAADTKPATPAPTAFGDQERERYVADDFDEFFQLSCVNHHVALLKIRVSKRYLHWLETGSPEASHSHPSTSTTEHNDPALQKNGPPTKQKKSRDVTESDILQLKRSKYYDLLSVGERAEFFVGFWRVMCWVMSDETNVKEELENVAEQRNSSGDA